MTVRSRFLALALIAGCKSSSTTSAAPAGTPPNPALPAPGSAVVSQEPKDDIATLPAKTDAGGEVIGIGDPRGQLAATNALGALALSAKGDIAAAEDARSITLWDLGTGIVNRRIDPLPEPNPIATAFAMSSDGGWLATSSSSKTRVFKAPFDTAVMTLPCDHVHAISHDGKLVECQGRTPEVRRGLDGKAVATAPESAMRVGQLARAVVFAPDDRSLYWATDREIVRWDLAGNGATSTVYKSSTDIEKAVFAAGGARVFVSSRAPGSYKASSIVVDLATGNALLPSDRPNAALSTDGTRLAFGNGSEVKVVDVGSGNVIWSAKEDRHVDRIAFAADADVLAYVAGNQLSVIEVPKGRRSYDAPARFAGWLGDGVAAVETAGKLMQLSLADHKRSAADASALAAKPPVGAPPWATWIAGDTAAEPSARHDASFDTRSATPCMPKLRVWTAKSGEKALATTCAKGDNVDPGWDLGGAVAVAVGMRSATVFDVATGRKTATIAVDRPRIDKPKFARWFWTMAVSADGQYLALVSVGPQLPPEGAGDPREDGLHEGELRDKTDCEVDLSGECKLDYLLTVYALTGSPTQVRKQPSMKPTSLAFDRTGRKLIVGTADGEIDVISPASTDEPHVERFHHGAVTRVVPAPEGRWVFSEDSAGQQRLWPLP